MKIIFFISLLLSFLILFIISGQGYVLIRSEYLFSLGLALVYFLGFHFKPLKIGGKELRIVDWTLSVIGFFVALYPAYATYMLESRESRFFTTFPLYEQIFAIIAIVLLIELARRYAGKVFCILILIFFSYLILGPYLPIAWVHKEIDPLWFLSFLYLGNIYFGASQGLLGELSKLSLSTIAGFLIFGSIMAVTGVGMFIINLLLSLVGKQPGGVAKATIWASAAFGMITGSPVAEVVTIGTLTIPSMIRSGFPRAVAGGIEAAAGCGGELMPPIMGAGAFIMAEILGISYLTIALAAVLPAILYFVTKYTLIHFYAMRYGIVGLPPSELPKLREVVLGSLSFFIPLIGLIILLVVMPSVMMAAFWTIILTLIVTMINKKTRISLNKLLDALKEAAHSIVTVSVIIIAADIISAIMAITGLGNSIANLLMAIGVVNPIYAIIIAMVGALLYGMFVPATAAYILAATTFSFPLIQLGFHPLAVHLFLFYFAILGPVTPPIALASYVAAQIARADFWRTGMWGIFFSITGFIVPFVFLFDTSLLLGQGDVLSGIWRFTATVLGTTLLGGALVGYYFGRLSFIERVVYGGVSLLFVYPSLLTDSIGIILFVIISIIRYIIKKK